MYEYKFVYFFEHCYRCKHKDVPEDQQPCTDCLERPVMPYSHKPAHFVEDKTVKEDELHVHQ